MCLLPPRPLRPRTAERTQPRETAPASASSAALPSAVRSRGDRASPRGHRGREREDPEPPPRRAVAVGTIAAELGRHHDTIERVLTLSGLPVTKQLPRPRLLDAYLPFIAATLAKHPRLRASRLWAMVRERGCAGSRSGFRAVISRLRPRRPAEAFLRRSVLAGQEAQVDWAHFGKLTVVPAQRDLRAFVMVLSYSRFRFLRFSLRAAMPSFLRGQVESFRFFGAVPRIVLYDNLKSAVLEREGDAVRFHPTLLAIAGHYRFEPQACAPYRPNEKGRERPLLGRARPEWSARSRTSATTSSRRVTSRRSPTSTWRRWRGAARSPSSGRSRTRRTRRWPRPSPRTRR